MQDLQNRLKAIRDKFGLTQDQIVQLTGISKGVIKSLEQGKTTTIKSRYSIALSNKLNISREWIESGKGDMMLKEDDIEINDLDVIYDALNESSISIPFFKEINASAGYGCSNGECKSTNITISKDMLPSFSKKIEAIRVSGNSMTPTINDEDIIFIDKLKQEPINGKIFVVFLCDEVYVKRIFIEPKTKEFILNSDNPIFPQIKADCEDFRIIGQVIANMQISKL